MLRIASCDNYFVVGETAKWAHVTNSDEDSVLRFILRQIHSRLRFIAIRTMQWVACDQVGAKGDAQHKIDYIAS